MSENQISDDLTPGQAAPLLVHGNEARSVQTPPGGIMTDEVGAITGPVELFLDHGVARVRYEGAIEVYRVSGDAGDLSLDEVVARLTADPGTGEDGNPRSTSLVDDLAEPAGDEARTYGLESADLLQEVEQLSEPDAPTAP